MAQRQLKRPAPDSAALLAGVDLGGTTVAVGLVSADGQLLTKLVEAVGEDHQPEGIVKRISGLLKEALRQAGRSWSELQGLGVCTPGLLDLSAGVVTAANLKGWTKVPLVKLLSEALGWETCHVTLEHDTNSALLAEAWVGAAVGLENIVLLSLGTGIGAAIICDGRLLRGSRGQAGEVGHAILVPDGREFGRSGVAGIFEGYASASAVVARAKEGMVPESSLSKLEALDCEDVFAHAAEGDAYAKELVRDTARYLAIGCINCCRFVDPSVILFSGGLAEAGESLLQEVRRSEQLNMRQRWRLLELDGRMCDRAADWRRRCLAGRRSHRWLLLGVAVAMMVYWQPDHAGDSQPLAAVPGSSSRLAAAGAAAAVGLAAAQGASTQSKAAEDGSTLVTSVLNLAKNIIGAGMLSLPVALRGAGLAPYVVGITLAGALNAYTFFLLGWCCEVTGASTFGELWAKCFGQQNAWIADVSVLMNNSMACLAYCVLMGDFFSKALAGLLPDSPLLHGRGVDLCIIGLCLLVPLSLMKDLAPLRYASIAGLAATAYVFLMLLKDSVSSARWGADGPLASNVSPMRLDFFEALALFGSAFMAHYNAPKFYAQLQEKSVPKFAVLVCMAYGLALVVFVAFGMCGFALFGYDSEGNILKNYGFGPEVMLAWLSMGFSVAFTYPLVFSGFRDSCASLLSGFGIAESSSFRLSFTLVAVAATILGGTIFSNVAQVNGVKGAILSPCLAFIYPAAIHLRSTAKDKDAPASLVAMRRGSYAAPLVTLSGLVEARPMADGATGKAAGKGRGPPPPPPPSGKAASKGSKHAGSRAAESIQILAVLMDGREFSLQIEWEGRVEGLRMSLGTRLGISSHRVKLAVGAEVLKNESTARACGLSDGCVVNVVILPPLYGTLGRAGVAAPGEVVAAKMELHDALAQAGKLTPIHTCLIAFGLAFGVLALLVMFALPKTDFTELAAAYPSGMQFEVYHWNLEPVRVQLKAASAGRDAGLIGAARAAMLAHIADRTACVAYAVSRQRFVPINPVDNHACERVLVSIGQNGDCGPSGRMASEAELPDERLQEAVRLLLKGRDLAGTSLKEVLLFALAFEEVSQHLVKQFVAEEISRIQAGEAEEAEEAVEAVEAEAGEEEAQAEEEAKEPPKASKPRGSKRKEAKEAKEAKASDAKRAKGTAEDPSRRSTSGEGKGKGKIKDRQSSSMTREEFMAKAKPITAVTIGDKTFKAAPKLFSTGSCGFMASTKVPVEVGGQSLVLQHSRRLWEGLRFARITPKGRAVFKVPFSQVLGDIVSEIEAATAECGLNLPVIGSKEWSE
ncbi:glcK [Symbiodinium sp. KB8]|nr:glcK [Symbiodinium sp. KB8]